MRPIGAAHELRIWGGRRGNLSADPRKTLFPPGVPVCGSTLQLSRLTYRYPLLTSERIATYAELRRRPPSSSGLPADSRSAGLLRVRRTPPRSRRRPSPRQPRVAHRGLQSGGGNTSRRRCPRTVPRGRRARRSDLPQASRHTFATLYSGRNRFPALSSRELQEHIDEGRKRAPQTGSSSSPYSRSRSSSPSPRARLLADEQPRPASSS